MAENCEKKSDKRLANLLPGGVPGNKGGGRPKSEIRNRCAEAFDDHIETLRKAALNEDGSFSRSDQLKAIDLLGKYGGLQQTDVTTGDQPIKPVVVDVSGLPTEEIDRILAKEQIST